MYTLHNNMLLSNLALLALGCSPFASAASSSNNNNKVQSYNAIDFTNVGFAGTYTPVKALKNVDSSDCTCEVGEATWFSGHNAPLNEALSVHFRGPLVLHQFAYYTTDVYITNQNWSGGVWDRRAYYDASSQTAENITFLTNAGDNSTCLGKALAYADTDGVTKADKTSVLKADNKITSDQEFAIFSNVSCPSSGYNKACGVYRDGIPAYHGFDGETKMFLFEFEMPTETQENSTSFKFYDMPAIWLLNAHIPRTSQYPSNANCSCWASGCGEFDIFEVMNGTEKNHLYSTFHTFQGIEDLGTGIQSYGYIPRNTSGTMKGGLVYFTNGEMSVFVSDDTTFDSSISGSTMDKILAGISNDEVYSTELAEISATAPSSSSSKSNGFSLYESANGSLWYYAFTFFTSVAHVLLF